MGGGTVDLSYENVLKRAKISELGFEVSIFPKNIGPARAALKFFFGQPAGRAKAPGRAENLEHLLRASRDLNQWHGTAHMHGTTQCRADIILEPGRAIYVGLV